MVTMAHYWRVFAALLAALMLVTVAQGEENILSCYTCTTTNADLTCYEEPEYAGATPVTECALGADQCCIIQRVDDKESLGTPESIFRGCIENCDPELIGEMIETADFLKITYQTYCNEHKCNNGPGNEELGHNNGDGAIIPNIKGDDGAASVSASLLLSLVSLLTVAALRRQA